MSNSTNLSYLIYQVQTIEWNSKYWITDEISINTSLNIEHLNLLHKINKIHFNFKWINHKCLFELEMSVLESLVNRL